MSYIKKQKGGDGYSFNLDQPIGGNPGFIRYSNNSRPIFEGELLDSALEYKMDSNSGYNILTGGNKKKLTTTNNDCGCSKKNSIYDLIKLQGGSQAKRVTQFDAIREVAYNLSPLKATDLTQLNVKLFNNIMLRKNEKKAIQFGGYANGLEEIIAPLGKNNLLVLAALLLLHHFAVEQRFPNKSISDVKKKLKGGNQFFSSITDMLSSIENSNILNSLQQAFSERRSSEKILKQTGGNPLRQLIEPLGSEAFLAVGILIIIERFFTSKINNIEKNKKTTQLKGGRVNLYYEKLFNLLAPITFNAFATEDSLKKMSNFEK